MSDKMLELMSEKGRKLHEEFTRCQNMDEICELQKKWNLLNESHKNNELPHYDMTLEEFDKKYKLSSHEEVWKNILK